MTAVKQLRCILCLLKCSRYLYYAKKLVCIAVLVLSFGLVLGGLLGKSCGLKILKGTV